MKVRIQYQQVILPDQRLREPFSEKQYLELVVLISTINSWNRLAIAAGNFPREKARG